MKKLIELKRSKENKWILQKNINNLSLFIEYLEALDNQENQIDNEQIKIQLQGNSYRGRTNEGSSNTMGVRLSQTCFYMFGYKKNRKFFPSPMTNLLLGKEGGLSKKQIGLVNLYSMQFPNPFSETEENFRIYIGRLIIKLLLDSNLSEKLYIDECIYFLMFIENINQSIYEDLVQSILEFRELSFERKLNLFKSIENYDEVFSNATHEMNYYFIRIFTGFDVFDTIGDRLHNNGNLFKFHHGTGNTYRNDAYASRKSYSGYITINPNLKEDAIKLNENFDAFEKPNTQLDFYSKDDWIRELYQFNPLKYIDTLMGNDDDKKEIIENIKNMVYNSKFGSRDGKSFEESLIPIFEMFRENRHVEWRSGSGDTDLLCTMDDENDNLYKINVDAKTSRTSTSSLTSTRLREHMNQLGSEYCIVVSPRFARGVSRDIREFNIVTIEAETLANYCLNECLSSDDKLADYSCLHNIILNNLGKDITAKVITLIDNKFEME